jgi:hypothetical protein
MFDTNNGKEAKRSPMTVLEDFPLFHTPVYPLDYQQPKSNTVMKEG